MPTRALKPEESQKVTAAWQAEVEAYARSARLDVVLELALADPAKGDNRRTG